MIRIRSPALKQKPDSSNYRALNDQQFSIDHLQHKSMSYPFNRGTIAFYGSSRAPKIPGQLALALSNEASKPIRAAIPVLQSNMAPTLIYGQSVTIEQLNDPLAVEPDQIYYIIDHNLRGTFVRASQDRNEDYLRLTSDNPNKQQWPAQYVRITSIRAIFRIIK